MKRTIAFLLLSLPVAIASAACRDVYDPMNSQWVYVCSEHPEGCHDQYDPMNNRWVMVCPR